MQKVRSQHHVQVGLVAGRWIFFLGFLLFQLFFAFFCFILFLSFLFLIMMTTHDERDPTLISTSQEDTLLQQALNCKASEIVQSSDNSEPCTPPKPHFSTQ